MGMELKQSLKMSQSLVMTPQLQQAIKLLQLSRMELIEQVREEMEQCELLLPILRKRWPEVGQRRLQPERAASRDRLLQRDGREHGRASLKELEERIGAHGARVDSAQAPNGRVDKHNAAAYEAHLSAE